MSPKHLGIAALVAVLCGIGGWVWGASGRADREAARKVAEQRADLTEARLLIREGQVEVYRLNFGDASQRFTAALAVIERVQRQWRETGQAERAGRLEIALAHVRDAARLATGLDAGAHQSAEAALPLLQ